MTELASEKEFADYLCKHGLVFERDYHVGPGNFDFCIKSRCRMIYCDVKEIHDSDIGPRGNIDAYLHVRGDIRKLRNKYKGKKLNGPVVLIAMNFSSNYFTGLTVARALVGDIGITFDRKLLKATLPLHHIPRGNAVFTRNQNTSISGVFVFDRAGYRHAYFENPYNTDTPMPRDIFPGLTVVTLSTTTVGQELMNLGNLMFWNVS